MNKIKIGWAEADITPESKVELYGQYYQRVSKGIHSRLGGAVLALESDNGEQAVMVSVDLANFPREFLNELRDKLKDKLPGLDVSKIIMNAIHTHSAPGVSYPGRSWWTPDTETMSFKDYRAFVIERLTNAVIKAWNSKSYSRFANSFDFATVGHCRRAVYTNGIAEMYGVTSRDDFIGMEGNEDSTVEILFTFNKDKNPTGAVVNVACPSQVMEATYVISSDFMGEVRRLLKEKFGQDFCTLCQISSAGDQSPRDLVRTRDDEFWCEHGVKVTGKRIYEAVIRAYEKQKSKVQFETEFIHNVKEATLPKRRASYQEYIEALENIKRLEKILPTEAAFKAFSAEVKKNERIPGRPGPYDSKLHHFVLIRNNEAVVKRYKEQKEEPNFFMELHTIRLGGIVFVTNLFELFLDFGLQIKARSKAEQTFVIQLSCGSAGYLPSKRAEAYGGYGGLIINGIVGSDGGKKLVDKTVAEINRIF
ncbi:MAG: hypothetical protein ABIK53_02770 [bacterium]